MKEIYLGKTRLSKVDHKVEGQFVDIEGEKFYKINHYNLMPDFFMTIVSDSDHWMYLSSNGSLSAGRKNRDNALFPYYTVDKIHDYHDKTGSKTLCLIEKANKTFLWEPFTAESEKVYQIKRNLYKSIYGNKIIFEEINLDLGVCFRYGWYNSERFGFVKKSQLKNLDGSLVKINILDGIQNILPYGHDYLFQNEYSNLLDGYKKNELLENSSLGLFMLSSIPIDRAEPNESLKTTTVWSSGLSVDKKVLLSTSQLNHFRNGLPVESEIDIRATRGAYFVNTEIELSGSSETGWSIVAEINQDSTDVANLNSLILSEINLNNQVNEDIQKGTSRLLKIVAGADGIQASDEELCTARHFSNTLFNVMRGGIFINEYQLDVTDFIQFVGETNKTLARQYASWLEKLPKVISYMRLTDLAEQNGNPDLIRICGEYFPLTFSRRHGDPSRPWNLFAIETKNENGTVKYNYQGNWRDIFQNWEALSLSFPEYLEGMIAKFLNASTADGYNPYRISRDGIDWESPDPEDPWIYIGYWGDHQIIYLQKFLELSNAYHPGKLQKLLEKEIFAFANVPYRIKSFGDMVKNPQDTIEFDHHLNEQIEELLQEIGTDARLLRKGDDQLCHVNLAEKVLISLLAKLSNFIPEAGIWLNTQRPEWNDANNALVGSGASMVTLYYLRRFLSFWTKQFKNSPISDLSISEEVKVLFDDIFTVFSEKKEQLKDGFSDHQRLYFATQLGNAGTRYRKKIYQNSFSGRKETISLTELHDFTKLSLEYMDQSIRTNKCENGMYHAYNLISFNDEGISIRHLYEMLEGQVAVLSSGYLSAQESLDVLNSLKWSQLFQRDQYSYLLYPDRELARFVDKNIIPKDSLRNSRLLQKLISDKNTSILTEDQSGNFHFNGVIRNADVLKIQLQNLNPQYKSLVDDETELLLNIYEEVFDHQSFTGRSGTFYGYEGLGCIYWHMVSKLLLAAQECYFNGIEQGADLQVIGKIKDHYYEIKAGIGLYKSPDLYGAFPTDAYSHTPSTGGAKQPGMTGQVKEDFISRMRELGVHVENGLLSFNTSLLSHEEVLNHNALFNYYNSKGEKLDIELLPGQLAFTFCQVPVIYNFLSGENITVKFQDGTQQKHKGHMLNEEISRKLFIRDGSIKQIEVSFNSE